MPPTDIPRDLRPRPSRDEIDPAARELSGATAPRCWPAHDAGPTRRRTPRTPTSAASRSC